MGKRSRASEHRASIFRIGFRGVLYYNPQNSMGNYSSPIVMSVGYLSAGHTSACSGLEVLLCETMHPFLRTDHYLSPQAL